MGKKKTEFQWQRGEEDTERVQRPSKGSRKREEQARKELVKRLLALSVGQRAGLPLSDAMQSGLEEADRLSLRGSGRSGYRRQLLHLAGLLRSEDCDGILTAIDAS